MIVQGSFCSVFALCPTAELTAIVVLRMLSDQVFNLTVR